MNDKLIKQSEIEQFQELLNKKPDKKSIRVNKFAGDSMYIPIGNIENRLDEIYSGIWSYRIDKVEMIGNSIICQIVLRVLHPIAKVWICRGGVGAVPVQLNKGEKELNFLTCKSDAFKKGVGTAKSQALRNAAQSLGEVFGRNLNREDVEEFIPISEQIGQYADLTEEVLELLSKSNLSPADKALMEKKIQSGNVRTLQDIIKFLKK